MLWLKYYTCNKPFHCISITNLFNVALGIAYKILLTASYASFKLNRPLTVLTVCLSSRLNVHYKLQKESKNFLRILINQCYFRFPVHYHQHKGQQSQMMPFAKILGALFDSKRTFEV